MRLADRLDPGDPLHDLGGRHPVVIARAGNGACGENAGIEDAAHHDADALLAGERQEGLDGGLLQQRIAPGEEHRVEIARPGETLAHRDLVDADADRLHDLFGAQLLESLVGPVHGLAEDLVRVLAVRPHIGVVDEDDVDPLGAEPQQRLLEGAHRAVIGIVERRLVRQTAREARRDDVGIHCRCGLAPGVHRPADLGRDHVAVARRAPQRRAEAMLGQAVAVMR